MGLDLNRWKVFVYNSHQGQISERSRVCPRARCSALYSPPLVDIANDHLVNCPSILSSSARKHSSNSANDIGITHTEKFIRASPPAMGHTRRARADWKTYERFDRRGVMGSAE